MFKLKDKIIIFFVIIFIILFMITWSYNLICNPGAEIKNCINENKDYIEKHV